MSFKVGDKVVFKDGQLVGDDYVLRVRAVTKNGEKIRLFRDGRLWISVDLIRHATPEEIAAGYRIDHCVEDTKKVELFGNSEELEVLEMIDVSPNCEVIEQ